MERENGYYWVLSQHNVWTVAQLLERTWYNTGFAHPLTEHHFLAIGERVPSNDELKKLINLQQRLELAETQETIKKLIDP